MTKKTTDESLKLAIAMVRKTMKPGVYIKSAASSVTRTCPCQERDVVYINVQQEQEGNVLDFKKLRELGLEPAPGVKEFDHFFITNKDRHDVDVEVYVHHQLLESNVKKTRTKGCT